MATVRISENLKYIVGVAAEALFKKEAEAIASSPPPIGDVVHRLILGDDLIAKLEALPEWARRTVDCLTVTGVTGGCDAFVGFNRSVDLSLTSPRVWPDHIAEAPLGLHRGRSYDTHVYLNGGDQRWHDPVFTDTDGVVKSVATMLKEYEDKLADVTARRDTFAAGVAKVLDAHVTLSPALKMWPPLWDLLPDDTKARHKQVVTREKKKGAEELGIDTSSLTTVVVRNKITK